jgi:hypothetical protein
MRIKIIFLLLFVAVFQKSIFAAEKTSLGDKVTGATFKSIAKAYITVVDFEKLKKANIERIKGMDEEKFKKRYAKSYRVISELPQKVKTTYGIDEYMSKQQAIRKINSMNQKKMCEIIDSIPEEVIAKYFKEYISTSKQNIKDSTFLEQVRSFWERIVRNATPVNPKNEQKNVVSK